MDKEIDDQLYYDSYREFNSEVSLSPQRRVILTRILKLDASRPDFAYHVNGEELRGLGQFQKSIIAFKRATIIDPENYAAQENLTNTLFKLEKEDEAFYSIKKALSLDPASHRLHRFLIETLGNKHRLEDLESFLKEILDMTTDPKSIPIFYYASAQALFSYQKYPQALVMYKKAIENYLSMGYGEYIRYGITFYHKGLFEEAIIQFEHTLESVPNDKVALNHIAHVNYCLGKVEKAREEFEFIIDNGLETHVTYSHFLLVLYHLGEDEEIINQYKNRLEPSVFPCGIRVSGMYHDLLKVTQKALERDDVDENMKEFHRKKQEGINLVMSFLNERMSAAMF